MAPKLEMMQDSGMVLKKLSSTEEQTQLRF